MELLKWGASENSGWASIVEDLETYAPDSVVRTSFAEDFVVRPQEKTAQNRGLAEFAQVSLVGDSKVAGVPHCLIEIKHGLSNGFLLCRIGAAMICWWRDVPSKSSGLGAIRNELLCAVETPPLDG